MTDRIGTEVTSDPSAVQEPPRSDQKRGGAHFIKTQYVRALLLLDENGESTKICVSGRTEQPTQLFLQFFVTRIKPSASEQQAEA